MSDGGHRPSVLISNRQDVPVDEEELTELAEATLIGEEAGPAELSLSFVGLEEMARLRARYLGEEGPTDVLSFSQDDAGDRGVRVLGDVVIAPAYAARNNPDLGAELRLLLVHGILHLLGHDHQDAPHRAAMWALQERYSGVRVP